MTTLDTWQAIGVICGALLAALTLLGLLLHKVVLPVFRGLKRLGLMADLFLGDKTKGLPSLPEQVDALRGELRSHVQAYHVPAPGSRAAAQPNGQRGRRHE